MATTASLLTVSRPTTATYVNSVNAWNTASANTLRRSDLGLHISETRTNTIRNPRCLGGTLGTPGGAPTWWVVSGATDGLTRQIMGTGAEDGIDYIDIRFYGTATATAAVYIYLENAGTPPMAAGQSWAGSVFVRLVGGSVSTLISTYLLLQARNAAGTIATETATATFTLTDAGLGSQRVKLAINLAHVDTAHCVFPLVFNYANGAVVDFTVRVGWPCLERGKFASAPPLPAPVTVAASTRAADVISLASYSNMPEGTIYAEFALEGLAATTQSVLNLSDGTNANRITLEVNASGVLVGAIVHGGATLAALTSGTAMVAGTVYKAAFAWRQDDVALIRSGGTIATDTAATIPLTNQGHVGSVLGLSQLQGRLINLRVFPSRFSNAQLTEMVA